MMYLVYNIRLQASLAAAAAGHSSSSRREQDGGNDDDDGPTLAPALHKSIPLHFPANHLKLLVKHLYSSLGAFCIHNLAFQGTFPTSVFSRLGLPLVALPVLCTNSDWSADVLPMLPLLPPSQKQSSTFTAAANREEGPKDTHRALETAVALWPTDTEKKDDVNDGCVNRYLSPTMATISIKASSSPRSSNDGKGGQPTVPLSVGQMLNLTNEQRQLIESALIDATSTINNSTCESSTLNFMRGALLASDCILTVSPGYASEISTKEAVACGLGDIISTKGIVGIMNGIDTVEWNPETDTWLPEGLRYDSATAAEKKAQLKAQLQERLGLKIDPEVPMFGFVGRLTQQKGVDVLMAAAPALLAGDPWIPRPVALSELNMSSSSSISKSTAAAGQEREGDGIGAPSPGVKQNKTTSTISGAQLQLVVLGTGDTWLEAALSGLELSFKGSAAGMSSFSEELAHWVIAASDFIIVPSRYEPCGLVAQCAVRYGSVPVVTAVGGLQDLVSPDIGYTLPGPGLGNNQDDDNATTMRQNVQNLVETMKLASKEWKSDKYNNMQKNCMELDVSWKGPAAEWELMLSDML
jgi:glycogen synthase